MEARADYTNLISSAHISFIGFETTYTKHEIHIQRAIQIGVPYEVTLRVISEHKTAIWPQPLSFDTVPKDIAFQDILGCYKQGVFSLDFYQPSSISHIYTHR